MISPARILIPAIAPCSRRAGRRCANTAMPVGQNRQEKPMATSTEPRREVMRAEAFWMRSVKRVSSLSLRGKAGFGSSAAVAKPEEPVKADKRPDNRDHVDHEPAQMTASSGHTRKGTRKDDEWQDSRRTRQVRFRWRKSLTARSQTPRRSTPPLLKIIRAVKKRLATSTLMARKAKVSSSYRRRRWQPLASRSPKLGRR